MVSSTFPTDLKHIAVHIILLLVVCRFASAQSGRDTSERSVVLGSQEYQISSSVTIVPGSICADPDVPYQLDNNMITFDTTYSWDSIMVGFRVFDFNVEFVYRLLDTSDMQRQDIAIAPRYKYRPSDSRSAGILGSRELNYAGSFSRGFSVGNAQSLVLNSNFNLQLAGDIGEGVKIVAAISDENIPIQPEGNTQVLQEFDRVYIKLSKDQTSVVAGDYNLLNPEGYFSVYNKRLQGLSVEHEQSFKRSRLRTRASAAAARGKFARQQLMTVEGNQGPYKLQGNNGERFIIIQSGSERVYIDGRLMQRGFEYDYIIDYNRAEVTFTPTKLITKDERVVVEFEYSDQSYLRTVYAVDNEWVTGNGSYYLNMYSEQDSRTATGTITLDSLDISTLSLAGDDRVAARRSGVRSVASLPDGGARILYDWQIVGGDSILVFNPMPSDQSVSVTFSEVADGAGDYVIADDLNVNGRVYQYVGAGLGNYIPSVQLIAPEQQQMVTAGVRDVVIAGFEVDSELALSRADLNRLSVVDDKDNGGYAAQLALSRAFGFKRDTSSQLQVRGAIEAVGPSFTRLNPFRAQEFARDWNVDNRFSDRQEYLYAAAFDYRRNTLSASYTYEGFSRRGIYQGNRHISRLRYSDQRWDLDVIGNVTTSTASDLVSSFYRPKVTLTYSFAKRPGYSVTLYNEVEHNQSRDRVSKDFSPLAISYDLSRLIISGPSDGSFATQFKVTHRRDRLPSDQEWVDVSAGTMIEAQQSYRPNQSLRIQWSGGIRRLDVERADLLTTDPTNTLVGRLDLDWSTKNNWLVTTSSFALDAGQEPKQEFVYFQVENPDLGEYVYLGEDSQGLDQSLFVYRPDDPRSFWRRTSQFNNEFIATNNQSVNQSIRIDLKRLLGAEDTEKTVKRLLSKMSFIGNTRLTSKVSDDESGVVGIGNFSLADSSLVAGSQAINLTFFWNRGDPVYDIQVGRKTLANKIVQIVGADTRTRRAYFSRWRINLRKYLDIIVEGEQGSRGGVSEQFDNRNFDIGYWFVKPTIQYRPTAALRLTGSYEYQDARQMILDLESAKVQRYTIGCNYRTASRQSLDAELSYADIAYVGEPGSVVEFELLQSLQGGRNLLWDLGYTRRVGSNIDVTFSYQGRRTGELPTIHTGRAQVKATF